MFRITSHEKEYNSFKKVFNWLTDSCAENKTSSLVIMDVSNACETVTAEKTSTCKITGINIIRECCAKAKINVKEVPEISRLFAAIHYTVSNTFGSVETTSDENPYDLTYSNGVERFCVGQYILEVSVMGQFSDAKIEHFYVAFDFPVFPPAYRILEISPEDIPTFENFGLPKLMKIDGLKFAKTYSDTNLILADFCKKFEKDGKCKACEFSMELLESLPDDDEQMKPPSQKRKQLDNIVGLFSVQDEERVLSEFSVTYDKVKQILDSQEEDRKLNGSAIILALMLIELMELEYEVVIDDLCEEGFKYNGQTFSFHHSHPINDTTDRWSIFNLAILHNGKDYYIYIRVN